MSVHAVVLIQCDVDAIAGAAEAIADVDGVSEVYSVAGEFDLVAIVRVPAHDDLAKVIPIDVTCGVMLRVMEFAHVN